MRIRIAALAFYLPGFALGQPLPEPSRYNTVDLQAEAQRDIAEEMIDAVLFAEMNDPDPARLANSRVPGRSLSWPVQRRLRTQ